MTPKQAEIKLQLNELLDNRGKGRIFGNIDTDLYPLSVTEIISLNMDIYFSVIQPLYERDDAFYATIKSRSRRND